MSDRLPLLAVFLAPWLVLSGCAQGELGPVPGDDDDVAGDDDDSEAPAWVDCPAAAPPDDSPEPGDCNSNGVSDALELAEGVAVDCNEDQVLDECQVLDDACVSYGAREFVEYDAGTLPIVLSMPHGGLVDPEDIPDREAATGSWDVATIPLGRAVDAALFERTGRHAHLVICQIHRDKLDCNRSLGQAQDGHPETVQAWTEYHAFIEAAQRSVVTQFETGLYVDIHGLAASRDKLELGYLTYPIQLTLSDERLDHPAYARRSSVRGLAASSGRPFSELLRGFDSLGALLQAGGFVGVPSPAWPDPGVDGEGNPNPYFNGGYNTARHGSLSGGLLSGVQIEANWEGVRDTSESRAAFGAALADALLEFLPEWTGVDPEARALLRVDAPDPRASERGDEGLLRVRRSGDLDLELAVGLQWSGAAASGADVEALPDELFFESGQDAVEIPVLALPDGSEEGPEDVELQLLPGEGYNVAGEGRASVVVVDAERVGLSLTALEVEATEGSSLLFELRRDSCGLPLDVEVALGGEASPGDDYSAAERSGSSMLLRFEAESASIPVSLDLLPDGELEGREGVQLSVVSVDGEPHDGGALEASAELLDGDLDPDLLAWWSGRIDGTSLLDEGPLAWNGELLPDGATGPALLAEGPRGDSLIFDGEDDVVLLEDRPLGEVFTLSFWFRADPELGPGFRYLYGHGSINAGEHLNVYLTEDGRVRSSVRGLGDPGDFDALDTAAGFRDAQWHHYALTVDLSGSEPASAVYLDGQLQASGARGGTRLDPYLGIYLGGRWDMDPTRDWRGGLDELRIVSRVLAPEEIEALAAP